MKYIILLTAVWCLSAIPTADTVTNFAGIKFKRIPAGTFQMGFDGDSLKPPVLGWDLYLGIYDEHPRHSVTLSQPFYIGLYEVKVSEFKKFNPRWSDRLGIWDVRGDNYPIHSIRWSEADSFCKWLTEHDSNGYTYRLPTEAEWEYSCRAGTTTPFYTGNSITIADGNLCLGWGCGISLKTVGSYAPNPWGLFDMAGNAMEWCQDWYGPYQMGPDTNPAGFVIGDYRVIRDGKTYYIGTRSAARGASIPEYTTTNIGFRVVIADTGHLQFKPAVDTLSPYQRHLVQSRPAPSTMVSGETYVDADSREFKRVRMTRKYYPRQPDTTLYVSALPITEVSVTDRKSAGLFVQALATKFGVLYRISNRYELLNANIRAEKGRYFITIIPELKYVSGQPHPDVACFIKRDLPLIGQRNHGPVYYNWNQATGLTELANGDLLMSVCSDVSENTFTTSQAVWRLRLGASAWDSVDIFEDVPGFENTAYSTYDYRRGQLVMHSVIVPNNANSRPFYRISRDNGATWSRPISVTIPGALCRHWNSDGLLEMGLDTMVRVDAATGNIFLSHDGGYDNWTRVAAPSMTGNEHAFCLLDNGSLLFFNRDDKQYTDIQAKWTLSNLTFSGVNVTRERSPFTKCCSPGSHNGCVGLVKLFSGRLIRRVAGPTSGVRTVSESVDQGRTWFCRWIPEGGNGDILQTRDGLIHFGTEMARVQGFKREYVISEQWLREQGCKDVTTWGFNEPGMVSDCEDTEPEYFDSLLSTESEQSSPSDRTIHITNYPNPFNPGTVIHYEVPTRSKAASYTVYDISGKRVQHFRLQNRIGKLNWNGEDTYGKPLSPGVYMGKLVTESGMKKTHRLILAQ